MHSWKKKLVVSQLAVACTMAIASQASAATDISGKSYDTFYYDGGIMYQGYVGYDYGSDYYNSNIYPQISGAHVDGVISTWYLDDGTSNNTHPNALTIKDSTIHGMITSQCMTDNCDNRTGDYLYNRLALTVDNSTIDDDFEHYNYYNADDKTTASEDIYNLGTAITLDQETDLVIQNNSHVAGITLTQGYEWEDNQDVTSATGSNSSEIFNNTIAVKDSVLSSGSWTDEGTDGFYGHTGKASDYDNKLTADDIALAVIANPAADNSMQTTASFDRSTINGDIYFESTFDENFGGYDRTTLDENGNPVTTHVDAYDVNGDGKPDSNGWDNTDRLDVTLTNGSKWVGAAISNVEATAELYDYQPNSIWPGSTYGIENSDTAFNEAGHVTGNEVYQSGIFNVTLQNGSEWDTRKVSNIDALVVDNHSQVNVESSSLLADSITLTNASTLNIGDDGAVATDSLTLYSGSQATLTEETASLYANTLTIDNGAQLNLGLGQVDADNVVLTDDGVFNIGSRDYVLDASLNNARYVTNDPNQKDYDEGVIALNSDGHLAVNGDVAGNYRVRIDNATGAGSIADYKGSEVLRVYDDNDATSARFTAANKADLGAYTYEAQQQGDTVVLKQRELTDYANMALSIPSANTNIWNLEQDVLSARLAQGRHTPGDNGGAWVTYFGGNFNGDTGELSYDQDVNGLMVGLDKLVEGNNAKWMIGAAAGFAKGDMDDRTGSVDQDSQSARLYSSAQFANNVFVDTSLSYSHYSNDLSAVMSNGQAVSGDASSDAWGFGLKLGYDWQFNTQGYLTPYASVSGLFQDGDGYQLSNDMRVNSQSYDSLRYELGADLGYTFNYGNDQAFTPYAKLAYVYDDASGNDADVNGDNIDNGVEGSAVRAGLGGKFSFTKNFSAYADANYLGGGDVDQDWAANVGVKYTW
ncbi:autotransporter outer membrane beta-barrel domain-containing protein [Cronobacter malonaticus]|uniref:autotransporter outer membrane beta-barrel domain-containing protein n=1 Tax=Cronobacter malonaticus TaxID=413503 RepID=UPI001375C414|nr:autotransporter outer membrane beta-barrel domain-containing protein [Cronobacter malonaticus]NCH98374.1 autotransporter outer membrane beta-barrel domain-containing protein [Cronobacter malonaticus]